MRAAVMRTAGMPLSIEPIELADPGPREVVVTMRASGVCHSDLSFLNGTIPAPVPCILGHEGAGVVESVGRDVTLVSAGDSVVLAWQSPCYRCAQCLAGQAESCGAPQGQLLPGRVRVAGEVVTPLLSLGTFADTAVVHETCLVPYPKHHAPEVAALVGCAVMTGVGAVTNTAGLRPGETALVVGCGGVGLSAIQGARLAGASRIIAVDRMSEKLELALASGATDIATPEEAAELIGEVTRGVGVDHAFDCVGITTTLRMSWDATRAAGKVTVVGIGPLDQPLPFVTGELTTAKSLRMSVYGGANARRDFPRLLELDEQGRLDLSSLISDRIELDQINDAFERFSTGHGARTVILY